MSTGRADRAHRKPFQFTFHDKVTVVEIEGHAVVHARQLGAWLGYAGDGATLTETICGKWSDEFIEGADVITLRGERLATFKVACKQLGLDLVDKRAPSLMLLTMSGVQLVLSRSEKPEGKAFRRWLVTEVIPAYESVKQLAVGAAPHLEAPPQPAPSRPPAGRGRVGAGGEGGAGGPPRPPRGRRPAPRALPDPDQPAIIIQADETTEEKLAAAFARGEELPRAAHPDELLRGQVLRLMRCTSLRAAMLAALERMGGMRAPAVIDATHSWQVELTQAAWLVRRLSAGLLVSAREEVGRLRLEHDSRDPQMVGTLVGLISIELESLPEGVLAEVLAAVPRWRSGVERPIPLPVSA
jgi:prophage antirepressor-like protein